MAWRTTVATTLRAFFEGLAAFVAEVRTFVDLVYLDLFPADTRELEAWETQFALSGAGTEATRRIRYAAAWAAQGGQDPDYIETVIHENGFNSVFLHEWWESSGPFVARDPREHTTQPLLGFYQCEGSDPWECFAPDPDEPIAPHCDDTLANDPGYIVNLDLTRRAPPPVPDDPDFWPYFLYFGGDTFPDPAYVDTARLDELKELILKLRPTQQWIVTLFETVPELDLLLYRFALDHLTSYEAGTEDDLRRISTTPNIGTLAGSTAQATSAQRPTATTLPEGRAMYFDGAQSVASDLAASTWNALHNPTGVITIALRFRAINASGNHSLLNTSGPTITNPGIDISYISGVIAWQVGKGGGASDDLIAFPSDTETHTLLIVKDGATASLYLDNMASAAHSETFAGLSAANATSPLTLGQMANQSNAWLPEVLIYDFAATEEQREAIAEHLSQWEIAPTQAQYIAHMIDDGLAHYFDGDDIAPIGVSTWTDTITETDMNIGASGGSRSLTTLDGHAALLLTSSDGRFDAGAAVANGSNSPFTVYTYAQIPVTLGNMLWLFSHTTPGNETMWVIPAGSQRVIRNAETSASLATDAADRHYTHVFRGTNDGANLVRRNSSSETVPALNSAAMTVNKFEILGGANGATYAFVVLYDRALNEGDLQTLYQMIARSL